MAIDIEAPGAAASALTAALAASLAAVFTRPLGVQLITASGTYTPTSGTKKAIIIGQGSGGGGGGCGSTSGAAIGGPGSAGETRIGVFDISGTVSVTIGAAGAATAAGNNNGNNGADCTFGSLMTCKPGKGGGGSAGNTIGTVGAVPDPGSGGVRIGPRAAPWITTLTSATTSLTGEGGSTIFGEGGKIQFTPDSKPATGYGSGGVGNAKSSTTTTVGLAGMPGCFLVLEFGS